MYKKSKLKVHPNFNGVYLTEDLTSLRAKMLKYVKEVGKNKFILFHTINGKIRMKRSAREAGTITNNERDTGTGNWLTIDSPDDLFNPTLVPWGVSAPHKKLLYYNFELATMTWTIFQVPS